MSDENDFITLESKQDKTAVLGWLTEDIFTSPFPRTNKDTARAWRENLWLQFRGKKIPKKHFERFIQIIKRRFTISLIENGFPAGTISGTSFGAQASNFTLKLKNNVTVGAAASSVTLMDEFNALVSVSESQRTQFVEIRLKKKYDYKQLFFARRHFQSMFLRDIPGLIYETLPARKEDFMNDDWYPLFEEIFGELNNENSVMGLRIFFNPIVMYQYQITLAEIYDNLTIDRKSIAVAMSPQHLGIIDIYQVHDVPDEEIDESEIINDEQLYLYSEVFQHIRSINLNPFFAKKTSPVDVSWTTFLAAVKSEKYDEASERFILEIDQDVYKKKGVRPMYIAEFFTELGHDAEYDSEYVYIKLDMGGRKEEGEDEGDEEEDENEEGGNESAPKRKQKKERRKKIQEQKEKEREERKKLTPRKILNNALDEPNLFYKAVLPFLITNSEFGDLILLPGVDVSRSTTNSVKLIFKFFGIEAARGVIVTQLNMMLQDDHSVHFAHMTVLADYMTAGGIPTAMTRTGHGKNRNALSKAAYEESVQSVRAGAIYFEQSVPDVASAILTGRTPNIGTGTVTIVETEEYKKLKEAKREDIKTEDISEDNVLDDLKDFATKMGKNITGDAPKNATDIRDSDFDDLLSKPQEVKTSSKPPGKTSPEKTGPIKKAPPKVNIPTFDDVEESNIDTPDLGIPIPQETFGVKIDKKSVKPSPPVINQDNFENPESVKKTESETEKKIESVKRTVRKKI